MKGVVSKAGKHANISAFDSCFELQCATPFSPSINATCFTAHRAPLFTVRDRFMARSLLRGARVLARSATWTKGQSHRVKQPRRFAETFCAGRVNSLRPKSSSAGPRGACVGATPHSAPPDPRQAFWASMLPERARTRARAKAWPAVRCVLVRGCPHGSVDCVCARDRARLDRSFPSRPQAPSPDLHLIYT
jgi:hypothetical protein